MALTKTPIELSSTPSIVDGGNATAITIDSSEDVTLANHLLLADGKHILLGPDSGDAFNTESPIRIQDSTNAYINIKAGTGHSGGLLIGDTDDDFMGGLLYNNSTNELSLYGNNGTRLTIDSSGHVGINNTDPDYPLHISGTIGDQVPLQLWTVTGTPAASFNWVTEAMSANLGQDKRIVHAFGKSRGNGLAGTMSFIPRADSGDNAIAFGLFGNNDIFNITYNGFVGIKTTTPEYLLDVGSTSSTSSNIFRGSVNGDFIFNLRKATTSLFSIRNNSTGIVHLNTQNSAVLALGVSSGTSAGTIVNHLSIASNGTVTIAGALSKGSGSFKIDHPLESKKDTHHLVHSFIEGPQADLIYRGKVDLSSGTATVNIDTEAGMTQGTFIALNTDVQCFTSNETDWDAVKGSVSGNILTINSQNSSSTATVSWMVIGERQDQHMKDTDWTDNNGKVIVEPLKPEEPEE